MEKKKQLVDVSETEIRLSFINYKLLKKEEFDLKGSHIYFVKGPNAVGKTSILQALRAAHEMKDDTHTKVSLGESEGINEYDIPGPDGKMYHIVYEFTDTTTKFVVFDENGMKISKITDMRNIFKYNHVDATEFIGWSNSAEGRRKQKNHILQLLPDEDYIKYKDKEQDEEVNFKTRTQVSKDLAIAQQIVNEYKLTDVEIEYQSNLDAAKTHLKELEEGLVLLQAKIEKGKEYIRVATTANDKTIKFNSYKNKLDTLSTEETNLTTQIESLRKEKEAIITKGQFPVDNLSFDNEGYLTIDGLRFDEHQTCESDTILIVAQLLCKMNITPIQILGDASLLDYNKLDKLYDIAEANGKIMFVDEIDRTLDKLVIVGYEKKEKEKEKEVKKAKTSTKDLF